jgi:hypothetical protein
MLRNKRGTGRLIIVRDALACENAGGLSGTHKREVRNLEILRRRVTTGRATLVNRKWYESGGEGNGRFPEMAARSLRLQTDCC